MATLAIRGPLAPGDLPGLAARVCARLDALPVGEVRCAVAGVAADAVAVDALAQLQLAAGRRGQHIVLVGASAQLRALVDLMGLSAVLG